MARQDAARDDAAQAGDVRQLVADRHDHHVARARADDLHQRARRDAGPDTAEVCVECSHRHRQVRRQTSARGPFQRQPAHRPVNRVRFRAEPRPQCAQLRIKLRQELGVRVAAPGVVEHRLVAGGADPDGQLVGRLGAGEHRGHPIGAFHPQVGGVEDLWAGSQAVEDLAEEPLAGVSAAALGEVLRAKLARQRGDLPRLGDAGVVLPQPGHCRGVFGEPAVEGERVAVAIHRQRRAARGIDPDADDLVRREAAHGALGHGERLLDRGLRAGHVVGGMLPGKVRVARQDDALRAVGVVPHRGRHLAPVGDVDDESADGVGAVIEPDGVLGCAHGLFT